MYPPQIEEIYENLLWIRADVNDMALEESQVEISPRDTPDTDKITSIDHGVEEVTHYLITAGSTATTLGQKVLHKMMEVWLDPKISKVEKIMTSAYVKEMTE